MDAPPIQYARTEDGVNIAYWTLGEGPPLIILRQATFSDPPTEWEVAPFQRFYGLVAKHFRVIRVFMRGTGPSGPGAFTQAGVVADLDAVSRQEGAEPFALCTTTLGFQAACAYLVLRPDAVHAAVFLEPVTRARWEATRRLATAAEGLMPEDVSKVSFQGIVDHDPAIDRAAQAGQDTARRGGYWESLDTCDVIRDFESNAAQVRVPVLAVDWPRQDGYAAAALIPGARVVTLTATARFEVGADDPHLVRVLTEFLAAHPAPPAAAGAGPRRGAPVAHLSPRELEVVALVAAGRTNAEVAKTLVISPATVTRHMSNILGKTGLRNRAELTRYAADHDLT